ncbi:MAG: urease accessory protein [Gammaproteobacteria bacterium]|nr:urease accessory protein [Gammaproteobacteria bacterium]
MSLVSTAIDKIPKYSTGWHASLSLGLIKKQHKTIVDRAIHQGPLRIQRAFYPEPDGTCHVYLLHPPGGVVGGDVLHVQINTDHGASSLITTPAANKFYRSNNVIAQQTQTLTVGNEACMEWLPQETIVYEGAYVNSKTQVTLSESAQFTGWDIVCLGRPASGEGFLRGKFKQHIELWRNNEPLIIDRCDHNGGSTALQSKWGMANYPVTATLYCTTHSTNSNELVNSIRESVHTDSNCLFSVTCINGIIVCRYLGEQVDQAKSVFICAWKLLRPAILNKKASVPRIWNT